MEAQRENNLLTERAPFTVVNVPSKLADNQATWKRKKNKEEEGGGMERREEEKEERNPLEAINPTDSRAVNMNSIWFCHLQSRPS